jgi:hypothetical protein
MQTEKNSYCPDTYCTHPKNAEDVQLSLPSLAYVWGKRIFAALQRFWGEILYMILAFGQYRVTTLARSNQEVFLDAWVNRLQSHTYGR